jgi:hypothetical protein
MDPLLKDWLTVGFSSAALIVSCASFYLSLRNFRRDRSHLKVSLDFERCLVVVSATPNHFSTGNHAR